MDIRPIIVEELESTKEGFPIAVMFIDPLANFKSYKRMIPLGILQEGGSAYPFLIEVGMN